MEIETLIERLREALAVRVMGDHDDPTPVGAATREWKWMAAANAAAELARAVEAAQVEDDAAWGDDGPDHDDDGEAWWAVERRDPAA